MNPRASASSFCAVVESAIVETVPELNLDFAVLLLRACKSQTGWVRNTAEKIKLCVGLLIDVRTPGWKELRMEAWWVPGGAGKRPGRRSAEANGYIGADMVTHVTAKMQ